MQASTIENAESIILSRVISADASMMPESVARELLKWGFSETDRQRMSELALKARQGTLDSEENAEIEAYERVSSFLGLVKSKARRSLQTNSNE
jgi:hypothetical protein